MMRAHCLFLQVTLLGLSWGASRAQSNGSCPTGVTCGQMADSVEDFLQCVRLPSNDTGPEHLHRLRGMLAALMDIHTFMRSSARGIPVLSLKGALELKEPLQNEDLVQMWLEVEMKPLLKSVSKHFLSCLSTESFSCTTYRMVVQELSQHFSELDPVRQKWVYSFFMYPFLSGDGVSGCVDPEENSVDWLFKNFGAFSVMARVKDFLTLNMAFSGLEVLDLLTPEQKAELLLYPEIGGLNNSTLQLVFHSLMSGGSDPVPTSSPGLGDNWTTSGYSYTPGPTYDPYLPTTPQTGFNQVVENFMGVFRPISSFAHEFATFTRQRNETEMRSATLTQFLMNWTLSELADMYRPQNSTQIPEFDVTNVHDWYQHVVMPVLRRFLPDEQALMQTNISMAFHQLFFLEHGLENETMSEIEDVCSITLDKGLCGVTDVVQNLAHVMDCAARSQLTLTGATVLRLVMGLSQRLSSLLRELYTVNLGELASEVQQIFSGFSSPALTQEHLTDPDFIQLWFQMKLRPLLPYVPMPLLSCLSTKNFSCPVYHTIVAELGNYTQMMDVSPMFSHHIYQKFIYSFLLHHNSSDAQCVSSANNSTHWLMNNFGFFSRVASIKDFYELNPHFSGLEALALLTPLQTAQLLLLTLPTPPEKEQVVDQVFDFLLKESSNSNFMKVLDSLVNLTTEMNPPCAVYRQIFERLYRALPSAPLDLEPFMWSSLDNLISIAPEECVPKNMTCPVTQSNGTHVCSQSNSSEVKSSFNTSVNSLCDIPLETYACVELDNFTANNLATLLSCDLPGTSSHSRVLWKMMLTKLSPILAPALDLLAARSMDRQSWSSPEILDVIGEIRVSMLTDQELRNSSVVHMWFYRRLRGFLPVASGGFLRCLSTRNISCSSYQQILQILSQHFEDLTSKQQNVVLKDYILRFLSHPLSGPGCVSFNSSVWLTDNLGPFSMFLSLKQLLQLNPDFNPLDTLPLLTSEQRAELLNLTLTGVPEKDINKLFDFFMEAPVERDFPRFLSYLPTFVPQGNLSCSAYRTLFNRLDLATATVSLETESAIIKTKMALSPHIPLGCVIYKGECTVTNTNETELCAGVNSTALQLLSDTAQMSGRFCDFTVEELACASLSALTAEDVVHILSCSRSSNSSGSIAVWKLLLSTVPQVLDHALELLVNTTLDPTQAAVPLILDAIREIRLDTFTMDQINHPVVVQMWFDSRLRPFLSSVSLDFLSCLSAKALNCTTYQHIVNILSMDKPQMPLTRQMFVYTHFMKVFLTRNNTQDPGCSAHTNGSADWLLKNLGAFSGLVSFHDLLILKPDLSAMDVLPLLTVRQLAEVSATPGQLTSPAQVSMVMTHVPNPLLTAFYDDFSPAIRGHESMYPSLVRSAMLQVVLDRANLSDRSVPDSVVAEWLQQRMGPLLFSLSPAHVAPYFSIISGRNCTISELGVTDLNSSISTLSEETQKEIHNYIIQSLQGTLPLRCYGDNYNHSFYRFLESTFMGFQFPNLTSFLSLMPHSKIPQLLNSMPPSDLGDFLRRPAVVDNGAELCQIYTNYKETPVFLETEELPIDVRRPTLPCVWPKALSSSQRSEVDAWFDRRLHNYLPLLTKSLINPNTTHSASCMAFKKLVAVMGEFNYDVVDFVRRDVFSSIRAYLTSASAPRCYNSSNPDLNSTAWFAEYIGPFFVFMTLEDLLMFGSAEDLKVFTVNPLNIALLNHSSLPVNLTDYYTQLVYLQDSNFNPLLLPLLCRCVAPGPAFMQLNANQSLIVLHNLTNLCTDLDPQIAAALAENFGNNIDASTIDALGNENTGLSTGQIKGIQPKDLLKALSTLSGVTGWNQGQAWAIFQSLTSVMQINASSLVQLGTLVMGVPSTVFGNIKASELLTVSKNPLFVQHLVSASRVVQHTFVKQIISVDSSSEAIVGNVPDEIASEIPRALLVSISSSPTMIKEVNKKKWKSEQAELFFSVIAVENATAVLGSTNNLSSSVLQGFTCTSVRSMEKGYINKLIKACRRKGKDKVKLVETQLTCMYYYIKNASDSTVFDQCPPDVLLYYDYSLVPKASCRSYFEQLSDADFSVFSSALSYKRTELFSNAKSCLGITNTSLTKDNISVLGNMCCYLDGSYIENSDPSILEKLKSCSDLTEAQAAAVQSLLLSGKTLYGAPSMWNTRTLKDLGMLPLYLTSSFYDNFDKKTKRDFLTYFLKVLEDNGVSRSKSKTLKQQIQQSIKTKTKRSVGCTVGEITQVTVSDVTFPFDYDLTQFNSCLSATTVRDNLEAITTKVDQDTYLRVVLDRLNEAYAASTPPNIPEDQVQLLGPASRVSTAVDITKWTTIKLDTLAALMSSADGPWEPSLAKAIIANYLATESNSLGSAELSAIGGDNLCSLDMDVLKNITQQSLKEAGALTVSTCTLEKKQALFTIASLAFSSNTRSTVSVTSYQLTRPYLGGASQSYVKSLVPANVNMDLQTFTNLPQIVMQTLNVSDVSGLLGSNLNQLKSYENQPGVRDWISRQAQAELDTLNLGLTGGMAATTAAPGASTAAPGASTAAPGASTAAPGASTAAPGASTVAPGASTAAPGASTAAPGASTVAPGASTAAPGASTAAPGASTAAPGASTAAPGASTASTTKTPSTTGKPNHGTCTRAHSGLSLLLLLLLLIPNQLI